MKKIFSGIQPSGNLHLGNYLGALKQWAEIQNENECIFCIVDLHAITVPQDPARLKEKILEVAALYIASGIDPDKSTIFVQSDRPEHSELAWILNCHTYMGELNRMTQYKDKSKTFDVVIKDESNRTYMIVSSESDDEIFENYKRILKTVEDPLVLTKEEVIAQVNQQAPDRGKPLSVGLFDYPALMAADILLYQTNQVPVGEDQKQHIEITRDLAQRLNNKYGEIFTIPKPLIKKETARIMALDDPSKKMSKSSSSPSSYIAITDDDETIRNKIKKAVTDSGCEIKADPSTSLGAGKPAITNLLNIFSGVTGREVAEIEKEFEGKTYGEFKEALAEAIIAELKPVREKYQEIIADKDKLKQILKAGAEKVAPEAQATLKKTKEAVGLGI